MLTNVNISIHNVTYLTNIKIQILILMLFVIISVGLGIPNRWWRVVKRNECVFINHTHLYTCENKCVFTFSLSPFDYTYLLQQNYCFHTAFPYYWRDKNTISLSVSYIDMCIPWSKHAQISNAMDRNILAVEINRLTIASVWSPRQEYIWQNNW